jgi:hypothetical protein
VTEGTVAVVTGVGTVAAGVVVVAGTLTVAEGAGADGVGTFVDGTVAVATGVETVAEGVETVGLGIVVFGAIALGAVALGTVAEGRATLGDGLCGEVVVGEEGLCGSRRGRRRALRCGRRRDGRTLRRTPRSGRARSARTRAGPARALSARSLDVRSECRRRMCLRRPRRCRDRRAPRPRRGVLDRRQAGSRRFSSKSRVWCRETVLEAMTSPHERSRPIVSSRGKVRSRPSAKTSVEGALSVTPPATSQTRCRPTGRRRRPASYHRRGLNSSAPRRDLPAPPRVYTRKHPVRDANGGRFVIRYARDAQQLRLEGRRAAGCVAVQTP